MKSGDMFVFYHFFGISIYNVLTQQKEVLFVSILLISKHFYINTYIL